mgnify:CR=1 FL=1
MRDSRRPAGVLDALRCACTVAAVVRVQLQERWSWVSSCSSKVLVCFFLYVFFSSRGSDGEEEISVDPRNMCVQHFFDVDAVGAVCLDKDAHDAHNAHRVFATQRNKQQQQQHNPRRRQQKANLESTP